MPETRLAVGTRVKVVAIKSGHGYSIGTVAVILRYSGDRQVHLAHISDPTRDLGQGFVYPEDIEQVFESRAEQANFLRGKVDKFEGLAKEYEIEISRLLEFKTDAEELAAMIAKIMASDGNADLIHKVLLGTGKFKT